MPSSYRRNSFDFVTNSGNFNPYQSLQEMLVPITAYHEAYDKAEEMYSQLADKASAFEYLSRTLPEDSAARQIYEGYANDFNNKVADFSRNGLTMGNRRALNNLRMRYQDEIGRLEKTYALQSAQIAEQRAALLKDPTLLLSRDASLTPFDKYLENPQLNYDSYSGALLASQVSSATTQIAKELTKYLQGVNNGYISTLEQEYGYNANEIAKAIKYPDSPGSAEILNLIVQKVIDSSGITAWADPYTLNRAYDYARQGLWNAIGQDKISGYNLPRNNGTSVTKTGESTGVGSSSTQKPNPKSSKDVQSKTSRYGSKKAYGGHLYYPGGPIEKEDDYEFKISPQLAELIVAMPDTTLDNLLTKRIGHYPESQWEADSTLMSLDKDYVRSMNTGLVNQYFNDPDSDNGVVVVPRNIYNVNAKDGAKNLEQFGKYFTTDENGNIWLNEDGVEAYNMVSRSDMYMPTPGGAGVWGAPHGTGFKQFMNDLGAQDYINENGVMQLDALGKLWKNYLDDSEAYKNKKYDLTKRTEFVDRLDSAQQAEFKQAVQAALQGEKGLREVSFSNKTNKYEPTGNILKLDEFNKSDYKINSKVMSVYGNLIEVLDKDGKVHSYLLPRGIDSSAEVRRDMALENIAKIQYRVKEYLKNGYFTDTDGETLVPTIEEFTSLLDEYKKALNEAYQSSAQLGLRNTTKNQEFKPISR